MPPGLMANLPTKPPGYRAMPIGNSTNLPTKPLGKFVERIKPPGLS
jgi:hypothetical protein